MISGLQRFGLYIGIAGMVTIVLYSSSWSGYVLFILGGCLWLADWGGKRHES